MSENEINLKVNISAAGQQALKDIDTALNKLEGQQKKAQEGSKKHTEESNLLNTSLGKQIPLLRDLSPVLGVAGLGFLSGATALGAMVTATVLGYQAFDTWKTKVNGASVASNRLTGDMKSSYQTQKEYSDLARKLNLPEADTINAMVQLMALNHDYASSVQMLTQAKHLAAINDLDAVKVAQDMINVMSGQAQVLDSKKNPIVDKAVALQTLIKQYEATGSPYKASINSIDTTFSRTIEQQTQGLAGGFWLGAEGAKAAFNTMFAPMGGNMGSDEYYKNDNQPGTITMYPNQAQYYQPLPPTIIQNDITLKINENEVSNTQFDSVLNRGGP